jgi:hypothetical protein
MEVLPISERTVEGYSSAWRDIETSFLDTAGDAVARADELVLRLLRERGYRTDQDELSSIPSPMDAWARAYAAVQPIARLNARHQATMHERREAMARYRQLLIELLRSEVSADRGS